MPLDADTSWFDTGNPMLIDAGKFVQEAQQNTAQLVGSPELAAFDAGFISKDQLAALSEPLLKSDYGKSLAQSAE